MTRTAEHLDLDVRFAPPAEDGTIEGVACRWDVVDAYGTTFDRRAFRWDGKRLPLLWSHDAREVVGSVRAVAVEADGLKIKGQLNLEVARAREVRAMLLAGDVGGLSIGFRRLKDEARANGIRCITRADLKEVSFVAFPAVPGSAVTSIRTVADLSAFTRAVQGAVTALKGAST
jgi:HK97 family phage prohead protease